MATKFVRQDSMRHSKIGKKRKKLQKWRKPKGRDSKMRLKKKSYPKVVSIGYKKDKSEVKNQILIYNTKDLAKINKNQIAILAKVGSKKKLEIIKQAQEKKIKLLNVKEPKK